MGGNNSKTNASGGEVLPAKIHPILRQRIEEFRKRRNGTLSKKELLKDDGVVAVEDGNYQSFDENEFEETTKNQTMAHGATIENLSKVVPLPISECETKESCNEHKDHDQEKRKMLKRRMGLIGPGSPSFKIYCTESEEIKEEELSEEQTIVLHQKSPSADSDESTTSALENPNEAVEIKTISKRKGNKKKKFGAMKKNLLHVKNLHMNRMMACTGNDRKRHLLEH
ncbi:putative histone-lysine N-methyltransferase SETD1A [Sesbania bispinosa]|nr:putative histone-lysine N-methyltransferase SETD1A [Sesbania bispinosa]